MNLENKRILVVGAARSGIKTCEFLIKKNSKVFLNDLKSEEELEDVISPLRGKLEFILGKHCDVKELNPDLIVVSPGVPLDIPSLSEAKEMKIEIISEIELSYRFARGRFIGITGTNGKTTTTSLIGELFEKNDFDTLVGGNIGEPLIEKIEDYDDKSVIVAELSSFQLESTLEFKPYIAAMLNLTPDHLDRHKTIEKYLEAKSKIFKNQDENDYLILNYDDPAVSTLGDFAKSKVLYFSRKAEVERGIFLREGCLVARIDGEEIKIIESDEIFIKGGHNVENAMVAALAGLIMGINPEEVRRALVEFRGVEHRLEYVGEYSGVTYVNDSKGTNPDASLKALNAYDNPIIIIAGGRNKGNSFKEYAKLMDKKCKYAVLIGEAKEEIKAELDELGFDKYILTDDYEAAVKKCVEESNEGDVVLLSPACASWDMFESYEVRGREFKELVKKYN